MDTQFKVDDAVLYSTEGICRITSIEKKSIGDVERNYYILKPVHNDKTTISVPVDNERLVAKMRLALEKDEVLATIRAMPDEPIDWIDDESERITAYKAIVSSGDTKKVIQVIKSLFEHKKDQEARGKKVHAVDERLLKSAEALLYDEFGHALGIEAKDVLSFINEALEETK